MVEGVNEGGDADALLCRNAESGAEKRAQVVQNGKMGKSHDFPLTERRKSGTINRTIKRLPQLTENVVHHRGTEVHIQFSPTVWAHRTLYGVRAPFFHFCAARA